MKAILFNQGLRSIPLKNHPWGTRQDLADRLYIPRPSLSRELALLKEQEWTAHQGRLVEILDIEAFEQYPGRGSRNPNRRMSLLTLPAILSNIGS